MKKIMIPGLMLLLLVACNTNNGGDNGTNQMGTGQSDSAQYANPADTTPTSNSDAYNTTDTGASKGAITDSSGKHSSVKNTQDSSRKSAQHN